MPWPVTLRREEKGPDSRGQGDHITYLGMTEVQDWLMLGGSILRRQLVEGPEDGRILKRLRSSRDRIAGKLGV